MKLFLWTFTLLGLLPLVIFSALHLFSSVAVYRELPQESGVDDEFTFTTTIRTVQFAGSEHPLVVSPQAWPAIVALSGAALCLVGLFLLIPGQPIYADKDGYARFAPLLKRVMSSSVEYPSLIVSAREGSRSLLVMRYENEWQLSLTVESNDVGAIARIRQYFKDRGQDAVQEYESADEEVDVKTTRFVFPLTGDPGPDSQACIDVFGDCLGVTADEPMQFDIDQ